MKKRNALTLVEVLLIISILIFMLAIVIPAFQYQKPKEYCRSNLKQLTIAHIMYSDDNDGQFVNGAAGMSRPNEPTWIGRDWDPNYMQGEQLSEKKQIEAIKAGALYPYCKNEKIFKCERGQKGYKRTYSIVDSLNGVPQPGNPMGRGQMKVMDKVIGKNRGQLRRAHDRAVFICVGWSAPGSYGVYYDKEKWWDPPPLRHWKGTTVAFLDANVQYLKWRGEETIKLSESAGPTKLHQHVEPKTVEGKADLQMVQESVWGELGYTPSVKVNKNVPYYFSD